MVGLRYPEIGVELPDLGPDLVLRPWTRPDAPVLVRAWTDPQISAWNVVPAQPTEAAARTWIDGVHRRVEPRRSVDLVMEHVELGVVGEIGFAGFSSDHNGALVGYWVLPEGRGRGFASRALRAATLWGFRALELDVIVARCHQDNVASRRTAASAGYRHEATDGERHQLWRCRRTSSECC